MKDLKIIDFECGSARSCGSLLVFLFRIQKKHGVSRGCSKRLEAHVFAAEVVLMKQDIFAFDICEDHEKFPV